MRLRILERIKDTRVTGKDAKYFLLRFAIGCLVCLCLTPILGIPALLLMNWLLNRYIQKRYGV